MADNLFELLNLNLNTDWLLPHRTSEMHSVQLEFSLQQFAGFKLINIWQL